MSSATAKPAVWLHMRVYRLIFSYVAAGICCSLYSSSVSADFASDLVARGWVIQLHTMSVCYCIMGTTLMV